MIVAFICIHCLNVLLADLTEKFCPPPSAFLFVNLKCSNLGQLTRRQILQTQNVFAFWSRLVYTDTCKIKQLSHSLNIAVLPGHKKHSAQFAHSVNYFKLFLRRIFSAQFLRCMLPSLEEQLKEIKYETTRDVQEL